MIVRDGGKGSNPNFLYGVPWADERFHYLQISIQIVTIVSLICATSEIVFGCWSLSILSMRIQDRMEISSTKSKHVVIGVAIFFLLSARIIALVAWIRSTRNENLRCYSVTAHCTFISVFVSLGLACLVVYFLSITFDFAATTFRPHTEVLLAFIYIAGFDILFTITFGFVVVNDVQCKIRGGATQSLTKENWVRPSHVSKWSRPAVTEVYV